VNIMMKSKACVSPSPSFHWWIYLCWDRPF